MIYEQVNHVITGYLLFTVFYEIRKKFLSLLFFYPVENNSSFFKPDFSINIRISFCQIFKHRVTVSYNLLMYLQNLVVIKRFGLLGIFVTENVRAPYFFIVLFNNSFSAFFRTYQMSKVLFMHVKFSYWYYLYSFYILLKKRTENWHCRIIFEVKLTRRCIRSEM